ncbi:MAG: hypothetical protein AMS24_04815 [Chlamydiae bacterium SM23_39]|nr:MAG: hypothetical protein AMS24_04815 [Chlamydiae bacterium SM23_39]
MFDKENFLSFSIEKDEKKIRIDSFLKNKFKDRSRSYFQYLIKEGAILINGKKIKKNSFVKYKDQIKISFLSLPQISLTPQKIPLNILFEDEHIICINKPANMVVHPACGNYDNTLVNALLYHTNDIKNIDDSIRPGIVHRLDKNTSGVLIAAKTTEAHGKLSLLFLKRKIEKEYICICIGKIEDQKITAPIKRNPHKRKEMIVKEKGKLAITEFKTIFEKNNFSLVKAIPSTGRTHQIRVHLKYLNAPILGDDVYGLNKKNKLLNIERQMLHAYKLSFSHPITNKFLSIKAPIPQDFKKNMDKLGLQIKKNLE